MGDLMTLYCPHQNNCDFYKDKTKKAGLIINKLKDPIVLQEEYCDERKFSCLTEKENCSYIYSLNKNYQMFRIILNKR